MTAGHPVPQGSYSEQRAAERLGIPRSTLKYWRKAGVLRSDAWSRPSELRTAPILYDGGLIDALANDSGSLLLPASEGGLIADSARAAQFFAIHPAQTEAVADPIRSTTAPVAPEMEAQRSVADDTDDPLGFHEYSIDDDWDENLADARRYEARYGDG